MIETISTRPSDKLLFGSAPNALAIAADGRTLYVANGTNNAVAVIAFKPSRSRLLGCFPTGWYPAALALDTAQCVVCGQRQGRGLAEQRMARPAANPRQSGLRLQFARSVEYPLPGPIAERGRTAVTDRKGELSNNRSTEAISAGRTAPRMLLPCPLPGGMASRRRSNMCCT